MKKDIASILFPFVGGIIIIVAYLLGDFYQQGNFLTFLLGSTIVVSVNFLISKKLWGKNALGELKVPRLFVNIYSIILPLLAIYLGTGIEMPTLSFYASFLLAIFVNGCYFWLRLYVERKLRLPINSKIF